MIEKTKKSSQKTVQTSKDKKKSTVAGLKAKAPKVKGTLSKEQIKELLTFITKKLDEGKAEEIATIDLEGKTSLADFLVVASGTSARHIFGLANNLMTDLKKAGYAAKISGENGEGNWVLIDVVDIIVHLFTPQTRTLYDLEGLWQKAQRESE